MIAIKDFEIPDSCDDCPFSISDQVNSFEGYLFDRCALTGQAVSCLSDRRHPLCPLVEVEG